LLSFFSLNLIVLQTLAVGRWFSFSLSRTNFWPSARGSQLILQKIECKHLYISICTIFHEPEYGSAKNSARKPNMRKEVGKMLEEDLQEFRIWLRVNPTAVQRDLASLNPRPQRPKPLRREGLRLENLIAANILEQWNIYEISIRTRNGLFVLRRRELKLSSPRYARR
jgi:hypothetical protein